MRFALDGCRTPTLTLLDTVLVARYTAGWFNGSSRGGASALQVYCSCTGQQFYHPFTPRIPRLLILAARCAHVTYVDSTVLVIPTFDVCMQQRALLPRLLRRLVTTCLDALRKLTLRTTPIRVDSLRFCTTTTLLILTVQITIVPRRVCCRTRVCGRRALLLLRFAGHHATFRCPCLVRHYTVLQFLRFTPFPDLPQFAPCTLQTTGRWITVTVTARIPQPVRDGLPHGLNTGLRWLVTVIPHIWVAGWMVGFWTVRWFPLPILGWTFTFVPLYR